MFENPHYGKNVPFFENDNNATDQAVISAYKEDSKEIKLPAEPFAETFTYVYLKLNLYLFQTLD